MNKITEDDILKYASDVERQYQMAGLQTGREEFAIDVAKIAVRFERERCAALADEYATWGGSKFAEWFRKLAAEIRA